MLSVLDPTAAGIEQSHKKIMTEHYKIEDFLLHMVLARLPLSQRLQEERTPL